MRTFSNIISFFFFLSFGKEHVFHRGISQSDNLVRDSFFSSNLLPLQTGHSFITRIFDALEDLTEETYELR